MTKPDGWMEPEEREAAYPEWVCDFDQWQEYAMKLEAHAAAADQIIEAQAARIEELRETAETLIWCLDEYGCVHPDDLAKAKEAIAYTEEEP